MKVITPGFGLVLLAGGSERLLGFDELKNFKMRDLGFVCLFVSLWVFAIH